MLLVNISFYDYSQWSNSSQTFSLLDKKASLFVLILYRKNIQKYNNTDPEERLLFGWVYLMPSRLYTLTDCYLQLVLNDPNVLICLLTSFLKILFNKSYDNTHRIYMYNSPILLFIWEFSHLKLSCFLCINFYHTCISACT